MTETEFLDLVRLEVGLSFSPDDLVRDFDELPGWDSVYLLKLISALEGESGRRLPVAEVMEARRLATIHELVGAS
ncbi:hypothetical protein [Microbispora sp. NPDC049125]|uniref:hypothetical protein n=1 Tax=Microbispora sp. NPDC049125 TaxID=3154929 RepID=UPI00346689DE